MPRDQAHCELESLVLLVGRRACWDVARIEKVESLADVEFRVSSQWGEDGIIEWLVQTLDIQPRTFIEFGVEDYREANTRFLLQNRNWKGLILDGDQGNIAKIRNGSIYWRHDLNAVSAFITRENINSLVSEHGFAGPIGLLSVDIDGNDYWVWDAIEVVRPSVVVCEYNAVLGDVYPITIPYRADFQRTQAHHSNLYYGASISALRSVAKRKGYVMLGSNLAGSNAFFIERTLSDRISPKIRCTLARPSSIRESRDAAGGLTFLAGLERFKEIQDLPVVRVDTGETVTLGSLQNPYSDSWSKLLVGEN